MYLFLSVTGQMFADMSSRLSAGEKQGTRACGSRAQDTFNFVYYYFILGDILFYCCFFKGNIKALPFQRYCKTR